MDLNSALRYAELAQHLLRYEAALEAKQVSEKRTTRNHHAVGLASRAAQSENHSVGMLADLLEENHHPAAPIIRKVYNGQGQEGNFGDHFALRLQAAGGVGQGDHLPEQVSLSGADRSLGSTDLRILRMADGQHLAHVVFNHLDSPPVSVSADKRRQSRHRFRSFLVPLSEQELADYTEGMEGIDPTHHNELKAEPVFPEQSGSLLEYLRQKAGI